MLLQAIRVFRQLKPRDFGVLEGLERWMRRYDFIPAQKLPFFLKLAPDSVEYTLGRLNKFKLVQRQTLGYVGYKLSPAGHDAIAIRSLVDRGILEAFGTPLGIGKEADIYDALAPDGTKLAVKFNRLGRTSFTRVRRLRPYERLHDWMFVSRLAAKREFEALRRLHPKVPVPKPIALDRHVLVMGFFKGVELANVATIDRPKRVLDEVLWNLKLAHSLDIVHADLSEHNVLIKPDGGTLVIDWPQWVPTTHPNADELLRRDLSNLLAYFRRKFGLRRSLARALELVAEAPVPQTPRAISDRAGRSRQRASHARTP